jgi:hypothetical protein
LIFVEIDGKVDWLGKCVAADAIAFSLLRNHLLKLQSDYEDPYSGLGNPAIRWAIEQMYDRLPSLLGKKLLEASALWKHEDLVLDLFWGADAAALQESSRPPAVATSQAPDDDFALEEPTSGDAFADLFAKLILVDNTIDGAQKLLNSYSLDTLVCLTQQISELRKPEKDRLDEAKAKYFNETIESARKTDHALYHQILGLDAPKPL